MQVRRWGCVVMSAGLLLSALWATQVMSQQAELSAEQRLRVVQYELNVCDMSARHARKTLTDELRQAVERAEKAEQALALAQEELKKRAAAQKE